MFTVYILYSETADRYYVGHTDDLVARLASHKSDGPINGRYTRKNGPWRVVYSEQHFVSRSEAASREREIKSWKSRVLIEKLVASSVGTCSAR